MKKNIRILRSRIRNLINMGDKLPNDEIFVFFKVIASYWIVENSVKNIFPKDKDSIPELIKLIDIFRDIFKQLLTLNNLTDHTYNSNIKSINHTKRKKEEIEKITKDLFGSLWGYFSKEKFYNESLRSLTDRLTRNNIDINWFKDKTCLDAGCGGGRYTIALLRLGAKKVIGIDIAEKGLSEAGRRVRILRLKNVYFKKGNVLNIPFAEKSFDFVLSNGVLHHTVDIKKGISEISRVLKKNGKVFLYLEGKGGLFWEIAHIGIKMLKDIPKERAIDILRTAGLLGNRVFYFIDIFYPLIQDYVTPKEAESWLKKYNFVNITRLYRGTDYDTNEFLFNPKKRHKYSDLNYGFGELRYIAEKA